MSKYVPPHMRNAAGGGNDRASSSSSSSYDQRSRQQQQQQAPPQQSNSRWSNFNESSGGGHYDRRGGGGGGYQGGGGGGYHRGGGGGYHAARKNAIGFHGDLTPNSRLERELFGDAKSSGINFDKYDDIPVETSGENVPECIDTFRVEELGPEVVGNLQLCKYSRPTPVQKYSIPIGLSGRDMMACAQTGSGKTGGFLFPTLAMMLKTGGQLDSIETSSSSRNGGSHQRPKNYPTALILAPTRELASQIFDEARKFCYCTGIAPVVIYGGAEVGQQLRNLERGCDLLMATPGRLVDLMERGRISLAAIRFLILDEADRMLDMGFEPQIRRIVEQEDMPRDDNRQTFMFSATFPAEIQRLAADFMRDYIFLTVGRVGSASKDVKQSLEYVDQHDKNDFVIRFLNQVQEGLILIFVETKRGADYLEGLLCHEGFPATSIHGDRSQREREAALKSFKTGRTPVLVATDVASRGLDIDGVTQVINYDLPSNIDDYVHRIGRTGRVGNIGHALSLVNEKNRNIARDLYELFAENEQAIPAWLDQMCNSSFGRGGGGRGGRRGGGGSRSFGGRDFRKDNHRGGNGGGYGGGGGGGGYRGGGGGGGGWRGGNGGGDDNSAW